MKNLSFKRKESLIRGLEIKSENKVKSPRNWDRIIYLVLLALFLFFLLRYIINTALYVEAEGQVLFDKVDIRNTDDCRIVDLFVERGDSVEVGDSLFSFYPDQPEGSFTQFGTYQYAQGQKKGGDVSWAEKQLFKKKEEIKLNNYVINEKTDLKEQYLSELERIRNEVSLDVLPRSSLDQQLSKISKISYEIQELKGENSLIRASLSKLETMIRALGSETKVLDRSVGPGGSGGGGSANPDYIFYSPLQGNVTRILKNNFEVALKEEVILSIHRPENIYIKAYFDQEDLGHLAINDVVNIEFPDGTESEGYIKRFYMTTYRLPEEFQKKYEPTTRALAADIFPTDTSEIAKWRTFWKLGVVITKFKY